MGRWVGRVVGKVVGRVVGRVGMGEVGRRTEDDSEVQWGGKRQVFAFGYENYAGMVLLEWSSTMVICV